MLRDGITYEILENGYKINLDGQNWIEQTEPYIPYPNLSYEEGCLKQIDDLCKPQEEEVTIQEQITELQLAIAELFEAQQGGVQ